MNDIYQIVQKIVCNNSKVSFFGRNYIKVHEFPYYKIIIKEIEKNTIQLEIIWNCGELGKILFKNKLNIMNNLSKTIQNSLIEECYKIVFLQRFHF